MSSQLQYLLISGCILGFAAMEFITRRYQATVRDNATANDTWLEVLMFVSLIAITQPIALLGSNALCNWLMPAQHNAWANLPWWAMAGLLLIGDDLTQYLWHRASHTPLLWPLHRAHHSSAYMSVRITYRNNFFYYLMMPGLWIGGVAVYLGFGPVYAAYLVIKLAVILGAHCAWAWDAPLYRIRALHPLMWVLERTISTPATHWGTTRSPTKMASATTRATSATCCSSGTCCSAPRISHANIRPRSACRTTSCLARSAGRRRCSTR
jgi:sterol desaturase/sphingolipid hydroxylase (fatty acid hydroxylase superfamily)